MKHIPWKETGWAVLFVVVLLAFYVGCYYALVVIPESPAFIPERFEMTPSYRTGGMFAAALLRPVHLLDKFVRPSAWEPDLTRW